MKLYIASDHEVLIAEKKEKEWTLATSEIKGTSIQCVAAEREGEGVFAGTFDHGLWYTKNDGKSWIRIGEGVLHERITSLHISEAVEKNSKSSRLYVGTEPSELFFTDDYGKTWSRFPALLSLPSKSTWSFPPRPYTHHVRDIVTGKEDDQFILTGIEFGGVVRSLDHGKTFEDRKEGSQFDCHTIKLHPNHDAYIYEAGGGGYAESRDKGETWQTKNEGLGSFTYLVYVAVDPADPEVVVVSAAEGPRTAYTPERANTHLYRRDKSNAEWTRVTKGLPDPKGSTVYHLHTNSTENHTFYAVNNKGIYLSENQGHTWRKAPVQWPERIRDKRIADVSLRV
ncbi:hypothetical protein LGQ02_04315 [Bacillus shivajii]|uniref:WD40/YVTN/BNR-like repeat-containing protein n=1 Tax=Bacillus shivajii TaxID=1983719 RepID=UPI001CF96156|nr:hypothetical protein [Bacillus shivajii]UCZ54014.1 hypothetical protein LGQ02_04315 [Bacillus shivajii]